jgi:hypothetical protein
MVYLIVYLPGPELAKLITPVTGSISKPPGATENMPPKYLFVPVKV